MKILKDKIFYIEDFLFLETCNFLTSVFSKQLKESDNTGIYGGPGRGEKDNASIISGIEKIEIASNDSDRNIAIDLFTSVCTNVEKTTSKVFNKELVLKSYFYSHMKEGGKNPLHVDNYDEEHSKDYSAILYLSNSYKGGEVFFPNQELTLTPEPGTLVSFIGNKDLKHEVKKVISGDRINIIFFLKESDDEN